MSKQLKQTDDAFWWIIWKSIYNHINVLHDHRKTLQTPHFKRKHNHLTSLLKTDDIWVTDFSYTAEPAQVLD